MHLFYLDDSRDENCCIFSGLGVPEGKWKLAFETVRAFRQQLRKSDGIDTHKELHATEFVAGRGDIADRVVTKGRRCAIFNETLQMIAALPGAKLVNVYVSSPKKDDCAFERLMNSIDREMAASDDRALLICDEGKQAEYTKLARKMAVCNIVEDPIFKRSDQSYFIQLVDFCAYAILRKEHPLASKTRYGLDRSFLNLKPVLLLEANPSNPYGIVR